jgi:hypothetical protein
MIGLVHIEQPAFGRSRAEPERFLSQPAPRLPRHDRIATQTVVGCASLRFHVAAVTSLLLLLSLQSPSVPTPRSSRLPSTPRRCNSSFSRSQVLAAEAVVAATFSARQSPALRRKAWTPLRCRLPGRSLLPHARVDAAPQIQAVTLDAVPLASGPTVQAGLPDGLLTVGTSRGPGSGGGVGGGIGTGIGSGRGPGMGPGAGGGIGGGLYRPGGA